VSRYQKGKTNLDFTEARDSELQWHQLGHMQVCTSLQTDNHASTASLSFLQAGCPSCRPTNSVKALKASSCTTNTEQIEVMELKGEVDRRVTNCVSSNNASTVVGVIHKLDRRRVLLTSRSTCHPEFGTKFGGKYNLPLFLEVPEYPGQSRIEGSSHAQEQLDSFCRFDRTADL